MKKILISHKRILINFPTHKGHSAWLQCQAVHLPPPLLPASWLLAWVPLSRKICSSYPSWGICLSTCMQHIRVTVHFHMLSPLTLTATCAEWARQGEIFIPILQMGSLEPQRSEVPKFTLPVGVGVGPQGSTRKQESKLIILLLLVVRPVMGGLRPPSLFLRESLASCNVGWKIHALPRHSLCSLIQKRVATE